MAQSQSSNCFDGKRRRRRPANLGVIVEVVSDQSAGERLHRAYELILFAAGRQDEKEACDVSSGAPVKLEDSQE